MGAHAGKQKQSGFRSNRKQQKRVTGLGKRAEATFSLTLKYTLFIFKVGNWQVIAYEGRQQTTVSICFEIWGVVDPSTKVDFSSHISEKFKFFQGKFLDFSRQIDE